MTFDLAISVHKRWKTDFLNFIKGNQSANLCSVNKDDKCELGGWLFSEAHSYNTVPEFIQLKQAHKMFHCIAGEIVKYKLNNQIHSFEAQNKIVDFENYSAKIIEQLEKLNQLKII